MERILITGALGQLGQEFIKYFVKNNIYVLASDIRSPDNKLNCDFEVANAMDSMMAVIFQNYNRDFNTTAGALYKRIENSWVQLSPASGIGIYDVNGTKVN